MFNIARKVDHVRRGISVTSCDVLAKLNKSLRAQELKDLPEFKLVLVRGTHMSRLQTSWTRHPTTVAVSGGWGRVKTKGCITKHSEVVVYFNFIYFKISQFFHQLKR